MALTSLHTHYANHITGTWVRQVLDLHLKYGPVVRIGPNHIALDGSVGWPEVYGHRPGKAEFQKLPPIFKDDAQALIVAQRDVHRRQRRQMGHAFSDASLTQQEPVIGKYVDMLMDRLSERANRGESINAVQWFNFTTFDIIGDLAFSEPFFCLENNGYHPWVFSIFNGLRGFNLRRFKQYYPFLGWVVSLGKSALLESAMQIRSSAKDKARVRMARSSDSLSGHQDFMHYMQKKNRDGGSGMSEKEILSNAPTVVIAGSETTATALSGFCFYITRNPKAYAALANEIRSAFQSEQDINLRSTASLEYLQACINEILRVYPPAAETPARISPGDIVDGKFVPAGSRVSVYQWATFHNPVNFADPDAYKPERWLPATHPLYNERFSQDKKSVFKPFSYGPRDCIGKNLAFSELRLIISRLFFRFDFELLPGQERWHDNQRVYLLWDKGPLNIRLQPREVKA
ncbi:hypothetical protein HIM_02203 [Hirsutella minnesotensis 3608]|nr:hypothetical protein HIM_02203 [Hirsutella minnesotensis 3608]